MINKLAISVMTRDGVKEASIVRDFPRENYVFFNGDKVHICRSYCELFSYFKDFVLILDELPYYETK